MNRNKSKVQNQLTQRKTSSKINPKIEDNDEYNKQITPECKKMIKTILDKSGIPLSNNPNTTLISKNNGVYTE